MVLLIIAVIMVGVVACYLWIKAVNVLFQPAINRLERKKAKLNGTDNPYIMAHRLRRQNDQLYDEYLQWLDRTGGDLPFDKWKTEEELRFEKKLNQA